MATQDDRQRPEEDAMTQAHKPSSPTGPSEPSTPTGPSGRIEASDLAAASGAPAIPADITALGYEAARDELATIVSTLESGRAGLEQSMVLWQRAEALARHCEAWLDAAQAQLDAAGPATSSTT